MSILSSFALAGTPYEHVQTGISLPETLGGLARGEVTPYEAAPGEAGVAVPYDDEQVEVTVFIRQIDPKKTTSAAALVEESLEAVKQLEKTGTYANVKFYQPTAENETAGWSRGAYTAQAQGVILMSFIYAKIQGGYAIKARITTSNPKSESIPKFIGEFQKIVNEAKPKN